MKSCLQTDTQSVYEHGISVKKQTLELIRVLKWNCEDTIKYPDWFHKYRKQILQNLLPLEIIEEYTTFHDVGKVYCLEYDENGKRHFPNHAEKSYQTWLSVGGNPQAAKLMRMDMLVHTMKSKDVDDFIKNPFEAITLLIVGLAEIYSNSQLFGGRESISFKIKFKQINKIGNNITKKLFGEVIL